MMEFVTGPLLYFSIAVFFFGLLYRAIAYIRGLDQNLDRVAYIPQFSRGFVGALASIFSWLVPAGTQGWRSQPIFTAVFFMFHIGAVILPFFLLGHTVVLEYLFGFGLPALPDTIADVLAILALVGIAGLALRRVTVPEARALTTGRDWIVLILAALPFITGIAAHFLNSGYEGWMLAHILSSELFLIAVPFTKLSHIVLFFCSRGQIGMDFAIKRGGAHRGSAFPW